MGFTRSIQEKDITGSVNNVSNSRADAPVWANQSFAAMSAAISHKLVVRYHECQSQVKWEDKDA